MLPIGMNFMFAGKANIQQESIPVGCVPSAAVTVVGGGVMCFLGEGVCFLGVCFWEGLCVLPRGCAFWGMCFPGTVLPGGVLPRGMSAQGVCIPECAEADTPPLNRMTDRRLWKYYLAATSLQTVIKYLASQSWNQDKYEKILKTAGRWFCCVWYFIRKIRPGNDCLAVTFSFNNFQAI